MIKGIFKRECKGRFLCEIEINDMVEKCYIASSSKLLPMIDLQEKEVLLEKNKGTHTKTKYVLLALCEKDNFIYLNLNNLNNLYYIFFKKHSNLKILREIKFNNYRADFFVENLNKLIEIKGLLSTTNTVQITFEGNHRAFKQLLEIKELLKNGYKMDYNYILLNSKITTVNLINIQDLHNKLFLECINLGLKTKFYSIKYNEDKEFEIAIKKYVNVNF